MIMERIKLGEICEIVSGSTPKTDITEYWDGNIDWITPAELTDETYIIRESQRKITHTAVQNTGLRPFPKDTVILSSRAPIGKVAIAGKEMYCNQGFKNLICSDRIDHRYLYWYLKGHTDYLNALGRGATFKEISKKIVENIEIPLPSLDEQMKCSNILKKCWDLILVHKKQIELYDKLVKARFVEMFGDVRYEPKYHGIPLRKICTTISGGTPSTKFPEYYEGDIPWISTVSLGPNHIDGTNAKGYITEEAIANSATKLIPANNILFGTRVGVGKSSLNDVDICTNQDIIAIIGIDESKFSRLFIKHVLDWYQPYFDSIKKGATILGIRSDDLKDVFIPQVSIDLQRKYEVFVEQVDQLKSKTQKSLDKTQLLFNSLMQQYFG